MGMNRMEEITSRLRLLQADAKLGEGVIGHELERARATDETAHRALIYAGACGGAQARFRLIAESLEQVLERLGPIEGDLADFPHRECGVCEEAP